MAIKDITGSNDSIEHLDCGGSYEEFRYEKIAQTLTYMHESMHKWQNPNNSMSCANVNFLDSYSYVRC